MSTGPTATSLPLCRAASRPLGDGRLAIGLHDAGPVGVVAVNEDLHFGVADRDPAGEVRADPHDPVDIAGEHAAAGPAASTACISGMKIRRQPEARRQLDCRRRAVFEHNGDRNILHVQRQAVAEQQNQHHRQHDADGDAAGIANDLPRFPCGPAPRSRRSFGREPVVAMVFARGSGSLMRIWPRRAVAGLFDDGDKCVFHGRRLAGLRGARGGGLRPAFLGPARGRHP